MMSPSSWFPDQCSLTNNAELNRKPQQPRALPILSVNHGPEVFVIALGSISDRHVGPL
jgi:hypothetical protein